MSWTRGARGVVLVLNCVSRRSWSMLQVMKDSSVTPSIFDEARTGSLTLLRGHTEEYVFKTRSMIDKGAYMWG